MVDLINRRRNQILVHSHIYYEMDGRIVSDEMFDSWCRELIDLQEMYPEESRQASYYVEFHNFRGLSGKHLPYNRMVIRSIAERLVNDEG